MRLHTTSWVPDDLLRQVIRFVQPPGVSKYDIEAKNSAKMYYGRCYTSGCAYHGNFSPLIIVRFGRSWKFPIHTNAKAGYLPKSLYNQDEVVVHLLAHELRHLWQHNQKAKKSRRGYVWGSRGWYSEKDADAYAIRMVRKYRKEGLSV